MKSNLNRREFLHAAAGVAALTATGIKAATGENKQVTIITDPEDVVAASVPAQWAIKELERALKKRSLPVAVYKKPAQVPASQLRIFASGMASHDATTALDASKVHAEGVPEVLVLFQGKQGIWACGSDARGLMYALLELVDRVRLCPGSVGGSENS